MARRSAVEGGRIGRRGTYVIPALLRRKYALEEGALVIAEAREDGILLRPAVAVPVEVYSPERRAEFLLTNSTSRADYAAARKAIRAMGLDPDRIPHTPPGR